MKSLINEETRNEIISRIQSLNADTPRQWGKMNLHQMLNHCILADEMFLGYKTYPRAPLGYIFGRMALRNMLKDDRPLAMNAPTSTHFKITTATGDLSAEKSRWEKLIGEYGAYPQKNLIHWFFGSMTPEQVGQFAYKHADHHLRQFGC